MGNWLGRLAPHLARIVNIELDFLAWKGCSSDLRRALRIKKAVPCALRNDCDHSGMKLERPGRPVVTHDFQSRSAVENVNQLVAGEMAFPMIFARRLDREKEAVAGRSQSCDASLAIRRSRIGGPSDHLQFRDFCVEIDDAR